MIENILWELANNPFLLIVSGATLGYVIKESVCLLIGLKE